MCKNACSRNNLQKIQIMHRITFFEMHGNMGNSEHNSQKMKLLVYLLFYSHVIALFCLFPSPSLTHSSSSYSFLFIPSPLLPSPPPLRKHAFISTPVLEQKEILTGKHGEDSKSILWSCRSRWRVILLLCYDLTVSIHVHNTKMYTCTCTIIYYTVVIVVLYYRKFFISK